MRTLLPDPPPADVAALLERRRQARADRRNEVWDGVLHMAPAPRFDHERLLVDLVGTYERGH